MREGSSRTIEWTRSNYDLLARCIGRHRYFLDRAMAAEGRSRILSHWNISGGQRRSGHYRRPRLTVLQVAISRSSFPEAATPKRGSAPTNPTVPFFTTKQTPAQRLGGCCLI